MPRGTGTRSVVAPEAAKAPAKKLTIAALDEAARDMAARRKLSREVAQWAFENGAEPRRYTVSAVSRCICAVS
eukprot:6004910-Prymnesium_polylepis.1